MSADGFAEQWAAWHREHEERRAAEHGFLAITGLHWLTGEPQRFDDAPGAWSSGPDGVTVDLNDGEELVVDGERVTGKHRFGVLPERTEINARSGGAVIEIARRGGFHVVRPRHPDNPVRTRYKGTQAYAPEPRWAVPGRFVPSATTSEVGSVKDIKHTYESPGYVEFAVDGRPLRLTVFPGHRAGTLSVLFTDATSGVTTYPANRSLTIGEPGPDGEVLLDFNRAVNLPCAYTEFATCPLPPPENRLPIAVEAGEKLP